MKTQSNKAFSFRKLTAVFYYKAMKELFLDREESIVVARKERKEHKDIFPNLEAIKTAASVDNKMGFTYVTERDDFLFSVISEAQRLVKLTPC